MHFAFIGVIAVMLLLSVSCKFDMKFEMKYYNGTYPIRIIAVELSIHHDNDNVIVLLQPPVSKIYSGARETKPANH